MKQLTPSAQQLREILDEHKILHYYAEALNGEIWAITALYKDRYYTVTPETTMGELNWLPTK